MSFPGSFPSQLTAIMEALLKAVVAEVTALVEDGAVELRLELRDRDRQILDKEREVEERDREIEERDRVIEELRDAVEELMARGDAAMSPAAEEEKDGPEQNESSEQEQEQEWSKEDDDYDDTKPIVKSEPTQDFAAASPDPHASLWPPPPPLCSAHEDTAAACSYGETPTYNSHEATEEFSHLGHPDLPLDSLLDMSQEHFYPAQQQQHGFSLVPNSSRGTKPKSLNAKQRKLAAFRCDQCGKAFTEKRRLVTHQSVHTGAKPYSCRKCGKKFSRRDNCVRHEKSDARCRDSPVKFNERKGLMQELNLASAVPNCSHFN